ncbi:Protein Ycf2 [Bienertia sinuspersici]
MDDPIRKDHDGNCLIVFLFFEERIERELDLARQCVVGKQGSVF